MEREGERALKGKRALFPLPPDSKRRHRIAPRTEMDLERCSEADRCGHFGHQYYDLDRPRFVGCYSDELSRVAISHLGAKALYRYVLAPAMRPLNLRMK